MLKLLAFATGTPWKLGKAGLGSPSVPCRTAANKQTLRVQRAQIWSMQGFSIFRKRNYGFGYIPSIWVLGPLGRMFDLGLSLELHLGGLRLSISGVVMVLV